LRAAEPDRAHRRLELLLCSGLDRFAAIAVHTAAALDAARAAAARSGDEQHEEDPLHHRATSVTRSGSSGRSALRSLLRDSCSGGNFWAARRPSASRIFAVYSSYTCIWIALVYAIENASTALFWISTTLASSASR